jgi:hypothetical protein
MDGKRVKQHGVQSWIDGHYKGVIAVVYQESKDPTPPTRFQRAGLDDCEQAVRDWAGNRGYAVRTHLDTAPSKFTSITYGLSGKGGVFVETTPNGPNGMWRNASRIEFEIDDLSTGPRDQRISRIKAFIGVQFADKPYRILTSSQQLSKAYEDLDKSTQKIIDLLHENKRLRGLLEAAGISPDTPAHALAAWHDARNSGNKNWASSGVGNMLMAIGVIATLLTPAIYGEAEKKTVQQPVKDCNTIINIINNAPPETFNDEDQPYVG